MDFYEYLGIKKTASTEDIKKAFRKMAKITHPDYNKKNDAFWEMVELNIIRDTLLDSEKRRKYDDNLTNGKISELYPTPRTYQSATKKNQKKSSIYRSVKNLFVYHCKVCGHEMTSTWKGYCLYHYLEATKQLHNDDFIFTYEGGHYQWADPPEELKKHRDAKNQSSRDTMILTPVHIGLYISLIIGILIFLLLSILTYI